MDYLNLYKIALPAILALSTFFICKTLIKQAHDKQEKEAAYILSFLLSGWFFLSLFLSLQGFFKSPLVHNQNNISGLIFMVLLLFIPIITFFTSYTHNKHLKKLINSINIKSLIHIQWYRLAGSIFILMGINNHAPLLFTIPPGILDISIGISSLIISARKSLILKYAKIWNYIGLFDFALAFAIYFMYFPFKILKAPAEQVLIVGFHPIAFIIIFPVPLAIILHILALNKLKET